MFHRVHDRTGELTQQSSSVDHSQQAKGFHCARHSEAVFSALAKSFRASDCSMDCHAAAKPVGAATGAAVPKLSGVVSEAS